MMSLEPTRALMVEDLYYYLKSKVGEYDGLTCFLTWVALAAVWRIKCRTW